MCECNVFAPTSPPLVRHCSKISNRSRLLPGVDGRSATARRFRYICAAYEAEAGGNVTEVERDLIRQAAGLTLRAELSIGVQIWL